MVKLSDVFDYRIVLASKSPRRLQLIKQMGFSVITKKIDVNEDYSQEIDYRMVAEHLAHRKADNCNVSELCDKDILLTADTMVFVDGLSYGKPKDRAQAIDFIQNLSSKKHNVITGCCLKTKSKTVSFSVSTDVYFKKLSIDEIEYYIDKYQPFDKAGAYGIQEWIGCIGVEKIDGCFYNVMGLPTQELFKQIKQII